MGDGRQSPARAHGWAVSEFRMQNAECRTQKEFSVLRSVPNCPGNSRAGKLPTANFQLPRRLIESRTWKLGVGRLRHANVLRVIRGVRYVHTNLIARDWRALARFYEDVFGCVPVP